MLLPFFALLIQKPVISLGPQVDILKPFSFGMEWFPDTPVVEISKKPLRMLMTAGISTYLLEGDGPTKITSAKKVLEPGPAHSLDNGYIGICGVYRHTDGILYGAFHAEDHDDMPVLPGGKVPGYFATILLASSKDDGQTWRKFKTPMLTSFKPKSFTAYPGQQDRGLGEGCLCVSKDGRFLYCWYVEHSRAGRPVGIGVARAMLKEGPPWPLNWKKYYQGEFSEPGQGGRDDLVITGPIAGESDSTFPSVSYNQALGRYLMVFNVHHWKAANEGGIGESGIYYSLSQDAVHWEAPIKIISEYAVGFPGKPVAWHPSIIWDEGSSTQGWMLYGYSPKLGHPSDKSGVPHYLVGRRVEVRG